MLHRIVAPGVYRGGVAVLPSVLLAVKNINEKHPDILPGYKLQINVHDTGVSTSFYYYQRVTCFV